MSNRDKLLAAIREIGSKQLREELIERMEIWAEDAAGREADETFDEVDAFLDLDGLVDDPNWRAFRSECRLILITAGFYQVVSEEQLARRVMSSGLPYSFKLRGQKYDGVDSLGGWLDL